MTEFWLHFDCILTALAAFWEQQMWSLKMQNELEMNLKLTERIWSLLRRFLICLWLLCSVCHFRSFYAKWQIFYGPTFIKSGSKFSHFHVSSHDYRIFYVSRCLFSGLQVTFWKLHDRTQCDLFKDFCLKNSYWYLSKMPHSDSLVHFKTILKHLIL